MKRFLSLLVKIGILGGIVFAMVSTNPKAAKHEAAIAAKRATLEKEDILAQTSRAMYGDNPGKENTAPYTFHDYFVCSKVTDPRGDMASFGFFSRVFVTQSEF